MPFMKGRQPIRRTLEYLTKGNLIFRDNVKIMTVNYNTSRLKDKSSQGARDFLFWFVPQIQYKNPSLQLVTFTNMTPSPFIRFFLEDGSKVLVDIDSKSKEDIHDHLKAVFCKSKELLETEAFAQMSRDNQANFGYNAPRWCICEVPGQVPCPAWVPLPKTMRGKYVFQKHED